MNFYDLATELAITLESDGVDIPSYELLEEYDRHAFCKFTYRFVIKGEEVFISNMIRIDFQYDSNKLAIAVKINHDADSIDVKTDSVITDISDEKELSKSELIDELIEQLDIENLFDDIQIPQIFLKEYNLLF